MNVIIDPKKFQDPRITAKGEKRAQVFFKKMETLWFNTGSPVSYTHLTLPTILLV